MSGRVPHSPRRERRQSDHRPPFRERDPDGIGRERRAAEADNYKKGLNRGSPTEYRDRNRENEKPSSRDSSEHGSRRVVLQSLKPPPLTPIDRGAGREFATSIQTLNKWATTKEILRHKRDKTKSDYEEARSFYERGKVSLAQFPIEAERAAAKCEKEKSTLEDLDKKCKDADANISSAMGVVAKHFEAITASKFEEKWSKPDPNIEERFFKLERQCQRLLDENRKLKQDYDWLEGDMKEKILRISADTNKDLATMNTSLLKRSEYDLSLSKSVVDFKEESSKYQNKLSQLQDQLMQQQALINDLSETRTNGASGDQQPSCDQKFLERIQSLEAGLSTTTTSNSELIPRIEALEKGQTDLSTIQADFKGLQNNVSSFDDDLSIHDERIKALENPSNVTRVLGAANTMETDALTNTSAANVTDQQTERINSLEEISNSLKTDVISLNTDVVGIKAAQDKGDEIYGHVMDSLKATLEKLTTTVNNIRADVETNQNSIISEQQQLFKTVEKLKSEQLYSRSARLTESSGVLQNTASPLPNSSLQNGVSKPIFDVGALQIQLKEVKESQAALQREMADLRNFQVGTDIGLSTLDTRMNNISTEHLSRQIIGQLQSAYPNLPQAETRLKEFKDRLDFLEKAVRDHTESIRYLVDGAQKQADQSQLDKKHLGEAVNNVRESLSSKQLTWEGNVTKEFAECYKQTAAFKKEVAEQVEISSKNLQNQIESIEISSKNLQKQIESIEHLIEFDDDDDDGKVETVKEKVRVLVEYYGTLRGEVDVLDDQIKMLKMGAVSRHAVSTSRADSVGPGSGSVSGTDRPTKKRSAPTSPSTPHLTDRPATHKRKRNELGPFVVDDDDDEGVAK